MWTKSWGAILVLGAGALVSCSGGASTQTAHHAIIDGEFVESEDHPEVGLLFALFDDDGVYPLCSATLIAPDVVLTAAHCLALLIDAAEQPLEDQGVRCIGFGTDFTDMLEGNGSAPEDSVCGEYWLQHPDFAPEAFFDGYLDNRNDLGLLFLDDTVEDRDFAYLPDGREGEQLEAGMDVEIVGYGYYEIDGEEGMAVKAAASTALERVGDHELLVGGPDSPRACFGDSGGPVFADLDASFSRRLVGVTSRAFTEADVSCDEGGVGVRVDAFWGWIDEELRWACDEGLRSDCEEPGLPDPAGAGCRCSANGDRTAAGLAALMLLASAGISRRRGAGPPEPRRAGRCRDRG